MGCYWSFLCCRQITGRIGLDDYCGCCNICCGCCNNSMFDYNRIQWPDYGYNSEWTPIQNIESGIITVNNNGHFVYNGQNYNFLYFLTGTYHGLDTDDLRKILDKIPDITTAPIYTGRDVCYMCNIRGNLKHLQAIASAQFDWCCCRYAQPDTMMLVIFVQYHAIQIKHSY